MTFRRSMRTRLLRGLLLFGEQQLSEAKEKDSESRLKTKKNVD